MELKSGFVLVILQNKQFISYFKTQRKYKSIVSNPTKAIESAPHLGDQPQPNRFRGSELITYLPPRVYKIYHWKKCQMGRHFSHITQKKMHTMKKKQVDISTQTLVRTPNFMKMFQMNEMNV